MKRKDAVVKLKKWVDEKKEREKQNKDGRNEHRRVGKHHP